MHKDLGRLIKKHDNTYPNGSTTWFKTDGEKNDILLTEHNWKYLDKSELPASNDGDWVLTPSHIGWGTLTGAYLEKILEDSTKGRFPEDVWTASELKFIESVTNDQHEVHMEDLKAIDSEDDDEIDTTFLKSLVNDETGETVKTYENGAIRANVGKIRYSLMPFDALTEVTQVLTSGAEKYGDHNWAKGFPWMDVVDSFFRHFFKWVAGQDYDKDSGRLHLAHMACNILFLLSFQLRGGGTDDRIKTNDV